MKNLIMMIAILLAASFSTIQAQDKKADKMKDDKMKETAKVAFPKIDVSPLDIALYRDDNKRPMARVIYSRPQMKEREIFGKLVPYGKVWRTGANEATEITLYSDMKVGDTTIKAGTYTMFAIPNEKEWTVILNKATNVWGAYDYKEELDVVRINVPARTSPKQVESFSMAFRPVDNGTHLMMGWDNTYVEIPFMSLKS